MNVEKSEVTTSAKAVLLGFELYFGAGQVKVRVAPPAVERFEMRIRNWGVSMRHHISRLNRYNSSWMAYFRIADTPNVFDNLDRWLRRHLRQVYWRQWKYIRTRPLVLSAWVSVWTKPDTGVRRPKALGDWATRMRYRSLFPMPTGQKCWPGSGSRNTAPSPILNLPLEVNSSLFMKRLHHVLE